jgi:hypothetical protein
MHFKLLFTVSGQSLKVSEKNIRSWSRTPKILLLRWWTITVWNDSLNWQYFWGSGGYKYPPLRALILEMYPWLYFKRGRNTVHWIPEGVKIHWALFFLAFQANHCKHTLHWTLKWTKIPWDLFCLPLLALWKIPERSWNFFSPEVKNTLDKYPKGVKTIDKNRAVPHWYLKR